MPADPAGAVSQSVTAQLQKFVRPKITVIEWSFLPVFLFMIFRLTAALALLVLALLRIFYRLHYSRRAVWLAYAAFILAILIPVDIYVPGFHGPLTGRKGFGPRLVPVLYGLLIHVGDAEAISGGCIVGIHDTRWRLVLN